MLEVWPAGRELAAALAQPLSYGVEGDKVFLPQSLLEDPTGRHEDPVLGGLDCHSLDPVLPVLGGPQRHGPARAGHPAQAVQLPGSQGRSKQGIHGAGIISTFHL